MKTIELATRLQPRPPSKWELEKPDQTRLFPSFPVEMELAGFIEYIAFCHNNHYSAIINPTDIWYMIQCEIATAVKKEPDAFSSMFTTTPGVKQEIITFTGNPEEINVYAVVDKLKDKVPTDVDTFLPQFSTDTIVTTLATHVAFCDMVSPYYSYSTCLCGIPYIEIGGTEEDWILLDRRLTKLCGLFKGNIGDYLKKAQETVAKMLIATVKNDQTFFHTIISTEKCGSGSDQYVNGWILNFMNSSDPDEQMMLKNVHKNTSKMEYKNLDTGRNFEMYTGILATTFKDQWAIPCYNAYRVETTNNDKNTAKPSDEIKLRIYSDPITPKIHKLSENWTWGTDD